MFRISTRPSVHSIESFLACLIFAFVIGYSIKSSADGLDSTIEFNGSSLFDVTQYISANSSYKFSFIGFVPGEYKISLKLQKDNIEAAVHQVIRDFNYIIIRGKDKQYIYILGLVDKHPDQRDSDEKLSLLKYSYDPKSWILSDSSGPEGELELIHDEHQDALKNIQYIETTSGPEDMQEFLPVIIESNMNNNIQSTSEDFYDNYQISNSGAFDMIEHLPTTNYQNFHNQYMKNDNTMIFNLNGPENQIEFIRPEYSGNSIYKKVIKYRLTDTGPSGMIEAIPIVEK